MDEMTQERVTFWFGCNMLRHGELIRLSIALLERVGIEVDAVGGVSYCCGVTKDGNLEASDALGSRSVERLAAKGNDRVVTWCPSCHIQLDDFIAPAHTLPFEYAHIAKILYEHRESLRPHLSKPVRRSAVLHQHSGFERRTPVNTMVLELLNIVPEYVVRPSGFLAPGHMCSPLSAVPDALREVMIRSVEDADGADDLVTIFHSCHRDLVGMERHVLPLRVVNYIAVLAESAGLPFSDSYKAWRSAKDPVDAIGADKVSSLPGKVFEKAILPELTRIAPKPTHE